MKTIVILAATSLMFVGCNRQTDSMNESARNQKDQIEQSKDAQKDSLNEEKKSIERSAELAKDQLNAQAKAEKQRIESQSDAEKAQINAQKKQVEAEAAAAKANVTAQEKINEAAGAAAPSTKTIEVTAQSQGTSEADRNVTAQVRQAIMDQKTDGTATVGTRNITVVSRDGKVTLSGTVQSEAEKQSLETKATSVSGVKSVDNKLEVKSQ